MDSAVFIDHLRGPGFDPQDNHVHYSVITHAELFAGVMGNWCGQHSAWPL